MTLCFWGKTGVSARPWILSCQGPVQAMVTHCFSKRYPDLQLKMHPSLTSKHHSLSKINTIFTSMKINVNGNLSVLFAFYILLKLCVAAILCLAHECFSYAFNRELIVIVQFLVTYCHFFFFGILLILLFPIS